MLVFSGLSNLPAVFNTLATLSIVGIVIAAAYYGFKAHFEGTQGLAEGSSYFLQRRYTNLVDLLRDHLDLWILLNLKSLSFCNEWGLKGIHPTDFAIVLMKYFLLLYIGFPNMLDS